MFCREKLEANDCMQEECGVFGIYSQESRDVAHTVYMGLYALQHRGQESCGIAVTNISKITYHKNRGLVPEVFNKEKLANLGDGDIAIGHVRYSNKKLRHFVNNQPLSLTGRMGQFAIAHNGNIVNSKSLKEKLFSENIFLQTEGDAEIIAGLINLHSKNNIIEGIEKAADELVGSYAFLILTINELIGVRDKYGIRPLAIGLLGEEYILSSETCAFDSIGAKFVRDVAPGEIVIIDKNGLRSIKTNGTGEAGCIFEKIYFARPDSIIDGCSIYESRLTAGKILAKKFPVEADVVCGVPDSAIIAGIGFSEQSGIPYVAALEKNRYVGRTFIQPDQTVRESNVQIKMTPIRANVEGKRIVLVDDSIVRGTTSKKIIEMLRRAGAKEVHMRISSPVVKYACYFGMDTQSLDELIGAKRTEKEICDFIGADSLKFLDISDCQNITKGSKLRQCIACFSGEYPMEIVE